MTSKKRRKKSPRTKLIDKCNDEVRRIIRKRDKNICQKCGKTITSKYDSHPSHVKSKGHHPYLRHDLQNVKLLCFRCHIHWWHREPSESWDWFQREFPYRADYLREKVIEFNQIGKTKTISMQDLERTLDELKKI